MFKKGNILALFVFFAASFLLTPVFAVFYEKITGTHLGYGSIASVGFSHPEYFEGFLFSVASVLVFGVIVFVGKFRHWVAGLILFLELIIPLITQYFGLLIVIFCAAATSTILGELILFVSRRLVVKK